MSELMGIERARHILENEVYVEYSEYLDILRWAVKDHDRILADRKALVRYVRAYYKSHAEQRRAYEALSQELRDEIANQENLTTPAK